MKCIANKSMLVVSIEQFKNQSFSISMSFKVVTLQSHLTVKRVDPSIHVLKKHSVQLD